jgi:hypothetical protein
MSVSDFLWEMILLTDLVKFSRITFPANFLHGKELFVEFGVTKIRCMVVLNWG